MVIYVRLAYIIDYGHMHILQPTLVESPILFNRNAKREAELCYHVEEMVSKEALELAPLPSPGF